MSAEEEFLLLIRTVRAIGRSGHCRCVGRIWCGESGVHGQSNPSEYACMRGDSSGGLQQHDRHHDHHHAAQKREVPSTTTPLSLADP